MAAEKGIDGERAGEMETMFLEGRVAADYLEVSKWTSSSILFTGITSLVL